MLLRWMWSLKARWLLSMLMCCRLRHISRLDPGTGLELDSTDLGMSAHEVVLATLQATATLQDSLLFPGALRPGVHNPAGDDTTSFLDYPVKLGSDHMAELWDGLLCQRLKQDILTRRRAACRQRAQRA